MFDMLNKQLLSWALALSLSTLLVNHPSPCKAAPSLPGDVDFALPTELELLLFQPPDSPPLPREFIDSLINKGFQPKLSIAADATGKVTQVAYTFRRTALHSRIEADEIVRSFSGLASRFGVVRTRIIQQRNL
jgi:hypothetical protein